MLTSKVLRFGLFCLIAITMLVTEVNAVLCPTSKFKCQLDSDATLETCKYASCGGSCCCVPGSVVIEMSGTGFGKKDVGDFIVAELRPSFQGNPPIQQKNLIGLVVCANKPGNDPWGVVEGETPSTLTGVTAVAAVTDNGTTAETFETTLDAASRAALDVFCTPGHVAVDFIPFAFTLVLSVVNPPLPGTVDPNNSLAAACVHPDPDSIDVVTSGPNRGSITGGPYDCNRCPFQDANNDGFADVTACASCFNTDGTLNGTCPPLGEKA